MIYLLGILSLKIDNGIEVNPIRPRLFDALGRPGGGGDSAPQIYFCSGQPGAMKLYMCTEQHMVNRNLFLDMSHDLSMTSYTGCLKKIVQRWIKY